MMRRGFLILLLPVCVLAQSARTPLESIQERMATPEPLPYGPTLMAQVRDQFPEAPLRMTGKVQTRSGGEKTTRLLVSELRFGDPRPHATFRLADAFGALIGDYRVDWTSEGPRWSQSGEEIDSPVDVVGTGVTGDDLSLAFLWWPGAEVEGIERVRARDAYVVVIDDPAGPGAVRLWIDKRALFVVEAETLDGAGVLQRRLEVDRLRKLSDEVWMVQDLVIRDRTHRRTIKIRFDSVEEL